MAREQYTNGAATTLGSALNDSAGSLTTAGFAGFPTSGQYRIKIDNELLIVTGGLGTVNWTVTRGAESTTATAHVAGAAVRQQLTAGGLDSLATVYDDEALTGTGRDFNFGSGLAAEWEAGSAWFTIEADYGSAGDLAAIGSAAAAGSLASL